MLNKISLAGDLGSGKSTVSALLIDALGAEYYSTGRIVRSIADRMGMSIAELNRYMETHPEIDTEIDDGLKALSHDERSLVIDSRMAWHFVENTFKVYMSVDLETSALRIMYANRAGEHKDSLEDTVVETRQRRSSERKRYLEQYGTDIMDLSNYNFVVDTTAATPDEVAAAIISAYRIWQENPAFKLVAVNPERLCYPDDEPDADKLMELSSVLEEGGEMPVVEVFEDGGDFCVASGLESALAYALAMETFIPARLVPGCKGEREYVKMKNSL